MLPTPAPPIAVQTASAKLTQSTPIRRGSVSERFVKCCKPGCPCATDSKARRGPYYSWTRLVEGKTQSRLLSREHAEVVKRQIGAGHQFREQVEAYWDVCEEWADQELKDQGQTAERSKKGGSKQTSKAKSTKKLTG